MINALRKLDNSKPMSRPVDDASSALYINDPKKGEGSKTPLYPPTYLRTIERLKHMENLDRLWIFAILQIYKSSKLTTSKPCSVNR